LTDSDPGSVPRRLATVVLTWNGREDTLACLESLREDGFPGPSDSVIVVDNGSDDGTEEAVRGGFPEARFVQTGANLGFSGGNNTGMRIALEEGYRLVMLLNNDTLVPRGTLETLCRYMNEHERVGALQPMLLNDPERDRIDSLGQELFSLPGARDRGIGRHASEAPCEPEPIFGACAAAAVYRAEALSQSGLLDEDFFVLLEDVDLSFRLRLHGWEVHLLPSAAVFHKRGISAQGEISGEKRYLLHRNILALAWRYWPARYLLKYLPFLVKGWLWGALYAARSGRWGRWAGLMKDSRRLRRTHRDNPAWRKIQEEWMQDLGFAYYWRKAGERLTGRPAIP